VEAAATTATREEIVMSDSVKLNPRLKTAVCCFHQSLPLDTNWVTYLFELGNDSFEVTARRCQDPECRAHYEPMRGYFGARHGEHPTFGTAGAPICNKHTEHWYPMFFRWDEDKLVAECPIDGCGAKLDASQYRHLAI
jgi:hypothetical protein